MQRSKALVEHMFSAGAGEKMNSTNDKQQRKFQEAGVYDNQQTQEPQGYQGKSD